MSGGRVRLQEDAATGEWTVSYRRYGALRSVKTGTTDKAEAWAMARRLADGLAREQQRNAALRPDWRPGGIVPATDAPPPRAPAKPFDAPRIGGR
jgi:hypothetical protein